MNFIFDRLKEKSTIVSLFAMASAFGIQTSPEVVAATSEALPAIVGGAGLLLTAVMPERTVK